MSIQPIIYTTDDLQAAKEKRWGNIDKDCMVIVGAAVGVNSRESYTVKMSVPYLALEGMESWKDIWDEFMLPSVLHEEKVRGKGDTDIRLLAIRDLPTNTLLY